MTYLLDANVLIALVDPDHVHHESAGNWLASHDAAFTTCPITQGALIRYLFRQGHAAANVGPALRRIGGLARHQFWPDDIEFSEATLAGVVGHRQVTDSYLCHLAAAHGGKVATYDRALASAHPTRALLVPTS